MTVALFLTTVHARAQSASPSTDPAATLNERFARQVDHRLEVPIAEQHHYAALLAQALTEAGIVDPSPQAFVLVDRSPSIQAAFILLRTGNADWAWIGATAISTGKVGSFDHFLTPLGVFDHTLDNPDFRAAGTFNKNHIRGYGLRGRRIFDFGWQNAERGWGDGDFSEMRLQMHATDPHVLEARLGGIASEGCIRIPSTLNVFLDHYGVLDQQYEAATITGRPQWILKRDRETIATPGRYLVIIDSKAGERPDWSPMPGARASSLSRPSAPRNIARSTTPS